MRNLLSTPQLKSYEENGFLVLPNFIDEAACQLLIKEAKKLISEFDCKTSRTIFSTLDQSHAKDQYFFDSSYNINFFYEKSALDEQGNLIVAKENSINKIGHALHDLNPTFNYFSRTEKIALLCADLKLQNALLLQSMYICKQPFIGGEVTCHQDGTYLHTKNNSTLGLWFALEDATEENGCLWAIPGGHRAPLKSRFLRENNTTKTEIFDHTPWPEKDMIPLAVSKGSLVLLHSLLPHMSYENTSGKSRHAYTLHVMCGTDEYSADNWLQRPLDKPFLGF